MAFKTKPKEPIPGQDCKDFKPMFWSRDLCKLASKCANVGVEYIELGRFGGMCQGIKYKSILDNDNPPKGGSGVPNKSGYGEKPKIKRPKPRVRPNK